MDAVQALRFIDARCKWEDRGYKTPCFIWQLGTCPKGYAKRTIQGKFWRIHRLAYVLHKGPIPEGLTLDHLCHVKNCCNPEHLEPVTVSENVKRAWRDGLAPTSGATQTHCRKGHEFTSENTTYWSGVRRCVRCARAYNRAWRKAKAATANHSGERGVVAKSSGDGLRTHTQRRLRNEPLGRGL